MVLDLGDWVRFVEAAGGVAWPVVRDNWVFQRGKTPDIVQNGRSWGQDVVLPRMVGVKRRLAIGATISHNVICIAGSNR